MNKRGQRDNGRMIIIVIVVLIILYFLFKQGLIPGVDTFSVLSQNIPPPSGMSGGSG